MKDFISIYKTNREEKKLLEKMRLTKSHTNSKCGIAIKKKIK